MWALEEWHHRGGLMQPLQLHAYSYEAREKRSSSEHGQEAWDRLMFHLHRMAREGPEVESVSNRQRQPGLVQPLLGLVHQVLVRHWRSGLIQPLAEAESEAESESEAEVGDLQL